MNNDDKDISMDALIKTTTITHEVTYYTVYRRSTTSTVTEPFESLGTLVVKIGINNTTGLVVDPIDLGIDPQTEVYYTPDKVRQLINTTEKIKDGLDGRGNVGTYISSVLFDQTAFKTAKSSVRFINYSDEDTNVQRADKVIAVIDDARIKRDAIEDQEKSPRFIIIPFGAKKSGIVGGKHIGAVIADLDASENDCVRYFDSSHDFKKLLGTVQKEFTHEDQIMIGYFADDTGVTVFGRLISMMTGCDKKNKIPVPINPKLQDSSKTPPETDCSYCVESLIHLLKPTENGESIKIDEIGEMEIPGFDSLEKIIGSNIFKNKFNSQRSKIKKSTQLDPSTLGLSSNSKHYPNYRGLSEHGAISDERTIIPDSLGKLSSLKTLTSADLDSKPLSMTSLKEKKHSII